MTMDQQNSPFRKLSADLRLHIIRHTNVHDLRRLMLSGMVTYEDFRSNGAAVFRGMEVEQFLELKWLLGDSRYRSPEQKQACKDLFASISTGDDRFLLYWFDKFDNNELPNSRNIAFLQIVQERITTKTEEFRRLGMDMTRRAALCFMLLAGKKQSVYENQDGRKIQEEALTLEDLVEIFEKQPANTQAEIRRILERLVLFISNNIMPYMGEATRDWMLDYYSERKVDNKLKPDAMGQWIAKLATGFTLEVVVPIFGTRSNDIRASIEAQGVYFNTALDLELKNSGSTAGLWMGGRSFAERVGFDFDRMLEGTAVGKYLVENVSLGEDKSIDWIA